MSYKFNPFTGNLDEVGAGGAGSSPGGADTQIQFNDAGSFGGDVDLTWNKTTNVMTVGGDINLDDGIAGPVTTLQTITPTANRTISFPDATGTVGLVAGSSGQLVYNNAGAYAGASGSSVGASGDITLSANGAASTGTGSAFKLTGSWYTGANPVPQALIQPAGTATSTTWSTSGTGLGVNAASGFNGNLLDLQVNGASRGLFNSAGTYVSSYNATTDWVTNAVAFGQRYGLATMQTGTALANLGSTGSFNLGGSVPYYAISAQTRLYSDATGIFAQRNGGTNAAPASQTFRLYNFSVDPANDYERTSITDDSTGLVIDQQYAGTGAARTNLLDVKDNGTSAFVVTSNAGVGIGGPPTTSYNLYNPSNTFLNFRRGTTEDAQLTGNDFTIRSGSVFAWSSTTQASGAADIALKRDQAGVVAITDGSTGTGYLKQTPVAIASLPAAGATYEGVRGFVNDASVSTFYSIVAVGTNDGGSIKVPVFCDGTNWRIG